ncbi:adenosylmethionine decarboxylase [Sphingomonas sp. G-3-2-10]|uniref:adenosylmethionine decarboxylase n=1 Tax=Sphingomonas sp. G-3-2-10 TaxID=2728838 RepID=UPI00146BEA1D|nr:adenosylmethionine decarboxylase [Sphingomonas sp. G-3-2-10]
MTSAPPYDGRHLIAELHDAAHLSDADVIEAALRDGATAAGATILDVRLHHFGPGQGVTGVALLAESHISIHTWPEHGYAAIDIFMCGRANDVDAALDLIAGRLEARIASRTLIARGFGAVTQPA